MFDASNPPLARSYVIEPPSTSVANPSRALSTLSFISFNCATFTASVSAEPAATPIIWRVTRAVALPTETAPFVAVQVTLFKFEPVTLAPSVIR